jgi:GNAT superfamily N-acetyltransferase
MDSIEIRPVTKNDLPAIINFIQELADYEKEPDAVEANEAMLEKALFTSNKQAEGLIAEIDDKPVGFAIFFHNFSTWKGRHGLYLEDLYVAFDQRGKGVGKKLLIRLASIAKERDCARFEWSALDWNTSAIDFYKSIGAYPMTGWSTFRLDGDALDSLAGS